MKNITKILSMGVFVIMSIGLFVGCGGLFKITDFEGLKDLPRNPSRIVFGTNSQNFDEDNEVYGDLIEYEIRDAKVTEVAEKLFAISYKAEPKDVVIDMPPITRILTFYNADGDTWTVRLGLQRHKERWYSPIQDEALIALLYESITE